VLLVAATLTAAWLLSIEIRQHVPHAESGALPSSPVERLQTIDALVARGKPAVPELIELASNADPKTSRLALFGLSRLGADAGEALQIVRERLADDDAKIRAVAFAAFEQISTDKPELAAVAAKLLGDADAAVREAAMKSLDQSGAPSSRLQPADVIPPVIAMAHDKLAATRGCVVQVLERADGKGNAPAVTETLRSLLDDSDTQVRALAMLAVAKRGSGRAEEIREWLRHERDDIVEAAIGAAGRLGSDGAVVLPELQRLLASSEKSRLRLVLVALGSLKSEARPAAGNILGRIDGMVAAERLLAAKTLSDIGAGTVDVVGILIPLLSNSEYNCAREAGELLAQVSPEEARRQVSRLIGEIEADEAASKLYALCGMGSEAREAVPLLTRLVQRPDGPVQWYSAEALGNIGPDSASAVPALISALNDHAHNGVGDGNIIQALGKIGPASRSAVPWLLEILQQPEPSDDQLRQARVYRPPVDAAVKALGQIGDHSDEVVAALTRQLTMERAPYIQDTALKSLALLGRDAQAVLPDVIPALDDPDPFVREKAALLIAHLPTDRRSAVTELTEALKDPDAWVCSAAALALQSIGPDAKSAVPVLRQIMADPQNSASNRARTGRLETYFDVMSSELQKFSVADAARRALAVIAPDADDRDAATE